MPPKIAKALETLKIPIDKLVLDQANARKHSKRNIEVVQNSLLRFGQRSPVVVQKRGLIVRAGNARVIAAKALGWTHIAALVVDESDIEAAAYALADNRSAELAEWDEGALASAIEALHKADPDALKFTGFDDGEISSILDAAIGSVDGEPEMPEVPAHPITEVGEVIELGDHRLLCGDCQDKALIDAFMNGQQAAFMFTDPPYGVSYAGKNEFLNAIDKGNCNQTKIEGDHRTLEEVKVLWRNAFGVAYANMKNGASFYVTGPLLGDLMAGLMAAMVEAKLPPRHTLVWVKNNHVLGRCDYHYKHEPIFYGWKEGSHSFYGDSSQTSVWEIDRPHKSVEHPTMKPVALVEKAMINSSKRGDIVLDPFLGSGTTLLAAERLGRKCVGVEISTAYCDVIVKRWESMTGRKAVRQKALVPA